MRQGRRRRLWVSFHVNVAHTLQAFADMFPLLLLSASASPIVHTTTSPFLYEHLLLSLRHIPLAIVNASASRCIDANMEMLSVISSA